MGRGEQYVRDLPLIAAHCHHVDAIVVPFRHGAALARGGAIGMAEDMHVGGALPAVAGNNRVPHPAAERRCLLGVIEVACVNEDVLPPSSGSMKPYPRNSTAFRRR